MLRYDGFYTSPMSLPLICCCPTNTPHTHYNTCRYDMMLECTCDWSSHVTSFFSNLSYTCIIILHFMSIRVRHYPVTFSPVRYDIVLILKTHRCLFTLSDLTDSSSDEDDCSVHHDPVQDHRFTMLNVDSQYCNLDELGAVVNE